MVAVSGAVEDCGTPDYNLPGFDRMDGHDGQFGLSNLRRERGVQRHETMDRHTS